MSGLGQIRFVWQSSAARGIRMPDWPIATTQQSLTTAQWPPTGSMGFHRHVPARVTRVSPLRQHPRFSRGCDDVRMLSSDTLFTGQQQIRVEHYGTPYRLKIPRQGS